MQLAVFVSLIHSSPQWRANIDRWIPLQVKMWFSSIIDVCFSDNLQGRARCDVEGIVMIVFNVYSHLRRQLHWWCCFPFLISHWGTGNTWSLWNTYIWHIYIYMYYDIYIYRIGTLQRLSFKQAELRGSFNCRWSHLTCTKPDPRIQQASWARWSCFSQRGGWTSVDLEASKWRVETHVFIGPRVWWISRTGDFFFRIFGGPMAFPGWFFNQKNWLQ